MSTCVSGSTSHVSFPPPIFDRVIPQNLWVDVETLEHHVHREILDAVSRYPALLAEAWAPEAVTNRFLSSFLLRFSSFLVF